MSNTTRFQPGDVVIAVNDDVGPTGLRGAQTPRVITSVTVPGLPSYVTAAITASSARNNTAGWLYSTRSHGTDVPESIRQTPRIWDHLRAWNLPEDEVRLATAEEEAALYPKLRELRDAYLAARPRAEHGSSPEWPIEVCGAHSDTPHYHTVNPDRPHVVVGWNGTVYETTGRSTMQGRRFVRHPLPDPDPSVARCEIGYHPAARHSHFHYPGNRVTFSSQCDTVPAGPDGQFVGFFAQNIPTVYPCTNDGHRYFARDPHTHSRDTGSRGEFILHGDPDSTPSRDVERQHGPDGQALLFSHIAPNTTVRVPETEHLTTTTEGTTMTDDSIIGTDLRPLNRDKIPAPGSVLTLTSRRGEVEDAGRTIKFGCQRFGIEALSGAAATLRYRPGNTVEVSVDVTVGADGAPIRVVDRDLGLGDINDWTQSIIVKSVAEPEPEHNALIMEHGFYGCATEGHNHIIFVLPGSGGVRTGHVDNSDGLRAPSGRVGQRTGLTTGLARNCRPVWASTTADTMNITGSSAFALVPASPETVAWVKAESLNQWRPRTATAHTDLTYTIQPCDSNGVVEPQPF